MSFHTPKAAAQPGSPSQLASHIEVEIISGMNNCLSVKEIAARITAMLSDPLGKGATHVPACPAMGAN